MTQKKRPPVTAAAGALSIASTRRDCAHDTAHSLRRSCGKFADDVSAVRCTATPLAPCSSLKPSNDPIKNIRVGYKFIRIAAVNRVHVDGGIIPDDSREYPLTSVCAWLYASTQVLNTPKQAVPRARQRGFFTPKSFAIAERGASPIQDPKGEERRHGLLRVFNSLFHPMPLNRHAVESQTQQGAKPCLSTLTPIPGSTFPNSFKKSAATLSSAQLTHARIAKHSTLPALRSWPLLISPRTGCNMANLTPRINLLTLPRSAAHRDAREIGRNILNDEAAVAACLVPLELYFRARFAPIAPSSMSQEQAERAAKALAKLFRQGAKEALTALMESAQSAEVSNG